MAEVEETSSASGGADLSSSAKMICFSPTSSGPFSWTNSTSITASLRLAAIETRAAAPSGSLASPWRASACNSSRISQPYVPPRTRKDRGPGPPDQAGADDGDVAFSACHLLFSQLDSHSQSTL